jgi:hypothetical protein
MDKEQTSLAEAPPMETVEPDRDLSRVDAEDLARSIASVREQMDAILDELNRRLRPIMTTGAILGAAGLGSVLVLRVRHLLARRNRSS